MGTHLGPEKGLLQRSGPSQVHRVQRRTDAYGIENLALGGGGGVELHCRGTIRGGHHGSRGRGNGTERSGRAADGSKLVRLVGLVGWACWEVCLGFGGFAHFGFSRSSAVYSGLRSRNVVLGESVLGADRVLHP